MFESIHEEQDNSVVLLIRYVLALVRCPMEDLDGLTLMAEGRYADELDIPVSDLKENISET